MDSPFQTSEDKLVEQSVKRDKVAFTALYERYVDQIYRHVYYRVGNQADAEDITEETFIRAWKAIDRFRLTGAPFVTWLIKITHNLIVDHYKAKKSYASLENVECPAGSDCDPEAIADTNLEQVRVRDAIGKLKGEKQRVILLRFIEGFSYAEIAILLKKTEGAVRVLQYRALKDLKGLLTD